MPLQTVQATKASAPALATSLQSTAASSSKPQFLVVYASLTGGRSWCGDCRAAEPYLNKKFGVTEDVAKVVYAGQPAE
jgi:thiol-disulfide isomerase/thioredoxin